MKGLVNIIKTHSSLSKEHLYQSLMIMTYLLGILCPEPNKWDDVKEIWQEQMKKLEVLDLEDT